MQSLSSQPSFLDVASEDIPRVAVYERRNRKKLYPDISDLTNYTEVENKAEVVFVNVFGEVTNERLEEAG